MQENICLEVICRSTVLTNKLSFERMDYFSKVSIRKTTIREKERLFVR